MTETTEEAHSWMETTPWPKIWLIMSLKFGIEQRYNFGTRHVKTVSFKNLSTKKNTLSSPTWYHISFQINLTHKKPHPLAQICFPGYRLIKGLGFQEWLWEIFLVSHIWGRLERNGYKRLNEVAEINIPWTLPLRNLGPYLAPITNMVCNSRHVAEPQSLILYRVNNGFPVHLLLLISN